MGKFILSFTLLLLSAAAFAQASFGIKAGGMFSNTISEDFEEFRFDRADPRLSYVVGGFASIGLFNEFHLQPELLYANKGRGRFEGSERPSGLHYLCLPVLLQYEVINSLRIGVGPEISYLLDRGETRIAKDWYFALNASVSYAFTEQWLVDLRYNLGIYDITEPVLFTLNNPRLIDAATRNRSVQLTLGYRFR